MTIKKWFYKHPNITMILLVIITGVYFSFFRHLWNDDRYGYALVNLLFSFAFSLTAIIWWEKHQ